MLVFAGTSKGCTPSTRCPSALTSMYTRFSTPFGKFAEDNKTALALTIPSLSSATTCNWSVEKGLIFKAKEDALALCDSGTTTGITSTSRSPGPASSDASVRESVSTMRSLPVDPVDPWMAAP